MDEIAQELEDAAQGGADEAVVVGEAKSLVCNECKKIFRTHAQAQYHAVKRWVQPAASWGCVSFWFWCSHVPVLTSSFSSPSPSLSLCFFL